MEANNIIHQPRMQISENDIKAAASVIGGNNNFLQILEKALIFNKAGLTPVYIYDPSSGTIELTSEERLNHKYH